MAETHSTDSRTLLKRLRDTLAEDNAGQERLDHITEIISNSMDAPVCSIYLRRDETTLELCATTGLKKESVHQTRLRVGQGLVGRIADTASAINTPDAPNAKGFRYMPETGEEIFSSFLGVPIQRLGEMMGVLVVQNQRARNYTEDEVYALEVVAMVLAEMAELGAFVGEGAAMAAPHQNPLYLRGVVGQEGSAEGHVHLHDPQIVISNPVADDPAVELERLRSAMDTLRSDVRKLLKFDGVAPDGEHIEVMKAYAMFANDKGWMRRMEHSIESGLAAEVAVEREQSATRARMERVPDAYLRERLHDLDDLANKLLRLLVNRDNGSEIPSDAILVARNIGPGELLEYGSVLKGVVLEEGAVGSHAAIVARALAIPLVIQAERITREALNGDHILVDGDQAAVHMRPDESVTSAFREKLAMQADAQEAYAALRDKPAKTKDGHEVTMLMNAGLLADLPSLKNSGAQGVGLYRTELQFLIRDIGSDKVLPYMKKTEEPNPALGWRAIRLGLDRRGVMQYQIQAMIRGAKGRPLRVMFPFVAQFDEFISARELLLDQVEKEAARGIKVPEKLEIGAMLETPSLAFAPDHFFEEADFISIGGNDLKQFFFAADRENERVRRRYDTLNVSFLSFLEQIVGRCGPPNRSA